MNPTNPAATHTTPFSAPSWLLLGAEPLRAVCELASVQFMNKSRLPAGDGHPVILFPGLASDARAMTSLYLVMPVGRPSWRHALIGGITAAVLWELTRRVLVWYLSTLSQVSVVYGSLATAIVVLLSLELGATLVLLGAQVISEYERVLRQHDDLSRPTPAQPFTTD